ncbi:MAG: response regulator [Akkermansiaceae bacterium]
MDMPPQGITVFLVESRPEERGYLAQIFQEVGWRVTASDGAVSLSEEESNAPSIVLVSAESPTFDLIKFVRQLRSHPMTVRTPLLVLAKNSTERRLIDALHEGADDIVFQPFTAERLVPRLRAHLCLAEAHQQDAGYVSHAYEQLRLSERRYRTLATATATIFWVASEDGRIHEPLPMWEEFTSQSPGEYRDRGWLAAVHPDDEEIVRQFWKKPGDDPPPPVDVEFRLRHRGGDYRQMRVAAVPVQCLNLENWEWVGTMTDISGKHAVEEKLRRSEEWMRLILESSTDFAIFTMDLEGRVTSWNVGAERLLGYAGEEICGTDFHRIFTKEDVEACVPDNELKTAYETGRGLDQRWHKRKDGSLFWADGLVMPLRETNKQINGYLKIVRDFTKHKKAEDDLRSFTEDLERRVEERTRELENNRGRLRSLIFELNKVEQIERQRIAAELHDSLAQLLTAGRITLESSIQQIQEPPAGLFAVVDIIGEATRTTRNLMADLSSPPVLESEDLVATIEWVIEKMSEEGLSVDFIHDEPQIHIKRELLIPIYQSVRELLLNVSKHASVSDAVVQIQRLPDAIEIEISDEGQGFVPKELLRSPGPQGGFGLLNIHERLRWLHGSLEMDSSPGHGTHAKITLPLQEALQAAEVVPPAAALAGGERLETPWAEHPAVLLVDDHRMVREGFRSVIEAKSDIRVVGEAADGVEAVQKARELHPDVVVMDINMPRMNGLEATRRIVQEMPDILVIGLSLHGHEEMAESIMKAGGAAYVSKEEAFNKLCDTIHAEVDKRNKKRQLKV